LTVALITLVQLCLCSVLYSLWSVTNSLWVPITCLHCGICACFCSKCCSGVKSTAALHVNYSFEPRINAERED